ncbi:hypothetical protein A1Q1_03863 [Trichosporon asahii var. asahii CBS 2479]|uniref:BTB domain-containing protein n=1 Tax=Trichosporon asahii var. asahii (strain ATCC 90039 / CBS 2479 / JCM 2466 / KCTC 7840 / NBRC 103889/ NCYC 2677 / UAMH 7654) TaxID=1186058 RepID=J6EX34_TRIAS|nr:hypothetical protein A1Q1_03863 [Trichosporon asahii var. asahii CBS 2479]EJT47392.1 hypothetical protein A1Q1_03863 [Trichosporon asahii var. asahii CBS 2479]
MPGTTITDRVLRSCSPRRPSSLVPHSRPSRLAPDVGRVTTCTAYAITTLELHVPPVSRLLFLSQHTLSRHPVFPFTPLQPTPTHHVAPAIHVLAPELPRGRPRRHDRHEGAADEGEARSAWGAAVAESVDNLHLWSDGDMTIHSADGVTFRVQSYHLLSASSVFRDLFAIGSGPRELSLSDESIETAPVMRMFLDLVTLGRLHVYLPPTVVEAEPTELRAIRALYALVHFLQKYECRVQLRTVLVEVRQRVDAGDWPPFLGFVVGAVADDERTWSGALQHRTTTWDRYIENVAVSWTAMNVRRLLGQSTLDPRCLPYDFWIMCPPEFMWALTVSWAGKDCPPEIFHLQVRTTLADLRKGRCDQNRMSQFGMLGQGLGSDSSSRPNTPGA